MGRREEGLRECGAGERDKGGKGMRVEEGENGKSKEEAKKAKGREIKKYEEER